MDRCLNHTCSSMNFFHVEQTRRALNISSKLSFRKTSVRNLVKPQPMENSWLTVSDLNSNSFLFLNPVNSFLATAGSIASTYAVYCLVFTTAADLLCTACYTGRESSPVTFISYWQNIITFVLGRIKLLGRHIMPGFAKFRYLFFEPCD
jgi:hypothetical protein